MIIRNIVGEDICRIPEIWRQDQPFVPVTRDNFIDKIIFEENFCPESFFVTEQAGEITGFLYCTYRKMPITGGGNMETGKGYILAFCVPNRTETEQVGGALLDAAEAYLRGRGVRLVDTGYFPTYYVQGIEKNCCPEYAALFKGRGYTVSEESYSMELYLDRFEEKLEMVRLREKLLCEGYWIGPSTPEDSIGIIDPKAPFSKESWAYEYKSRLKLQHDCERIHLAKKDGRIIGVSPFGDPNSDMGRFGPFGVDPQYRGLGIGKVLFYETLKEMKKRGIERAWMQWVEDTGAGFHIYDMFGFQKKNCFLSFQKEV